MASSSEENKGVESLKNFERALGHVRNSVRPLALMSRDEVVTCVSAADRAKLNLQVAYGVSSLFYMFLKTQGVSPLGHPVKAELDRIRGYFVRLKSLSQPPEQRTLKVDAEASRRFINAALSSDSVWQNAKSTDSKIAQKKRAAAGIGRSEPAGEPEKIHKPKAASAAVAAGGAPAESAGVGGRSNSSGGGGSASGKRKHAAADGSAGDSSSPAAGGWTAVEKRRSGGGERVIKRSEAGLAATHKAVSPQREDGPDAAAPGESLRATKKAKGTTGSGTNKKSARYHVW